MRVYLRARVTRRAASPLCASCVAVAGWEDEDLLLVGYTVEPASKRRKGTDEGVCVRFTERHLVTLSVSKEECSASLVEHANHISRRSYCVMSFHKSNLCGELPARVAPPRPTSGQWDAFWTEGCWPITLLWTPCRRSIGTTKR